MNDDTTRVLTRRELWSVLAMLFAFVSVTVLSIGLAAWIVAGGNP